MNSMLRCRLPGIRALNGASSSRRASVLVSTSSTSQGRLIPPGHKMSRQAREQHSFSSVSEKETLNEIRQLKARLASLDKQEEAQQASERMGNLDEETLEMVYRAINTADPPPPEELRLETRRRQRLVNSGNSADFIHTWHGRRIVRRLESLNERMQEVHPAARQGIGSEKDAYERVTLLLKSLDEPVEEEAAPVITNELERIPDKDTTGVLLFHGAEARDQLLGRITEMSRLLDVQSLERSGQPIAMPLGIATKQEWEALAVAFAHAGDEAGVQRTLEAMGQMGHLSSQTEVMNAAMDVYAGRGEVEKCQAALSWMSSKGVLSNDYTHHCLVKSFLCSSRLDQAVDLLHQLEKKQPASLQTYTLVVEHLLQQTSSPALQSKAWSLFYQMRLTAHPVPDAPLYAQMITACALGVQQPNATLWKPKDPLMASTNKKPTKRTSTQADSERALDLFREMTIRYNLRPTPEVYGAVILACAKRKDMYEKAIELFQSMVALERNRLQDGGAKASSFAPNRETYNALLQGCAKNGDLLRARWILAEMLRTASLKWDELMGKQERGETLHEVELRDIEATRPDEQTLSLVFFTYASCSLAAKTTPRVMTKAGDDQVRQSVGESSTGEAREVAVEERVERNEEGTLTQQVPSTSKAVLREAVSLMERIKTDVESGSGLFSSIQPTPRLLNGFLAVLSRHCSERDRVERIHDAWLGRPGEEASLFAQLNVEANGYTCEIVLDACSKISSRTDTLAFASEVWKLWLDMGGNGHLYRSDGREAKQRGLDSLTISRAWSAMMKTAAKSGELDRAMALLHEFSTLYPPLVSATAPPDRASTSLLSPVRGKDITRLQQTTGAPAPLLRFQQVEVLHKRLVESEGRKKDIAFMSWLIRSYEASTRPRIPEALRGASLLGKQGAVQRIVAQRMSRHTPRKPYARQSQG